MFSIVSCSEDDRLGISDDAGEDGVYINVTISIGGNRSATRATATPGADPDADNIGVRDGSFAENYIDPDDVRLFVYDQEGKFVNEFTITYTGHGSNTGNVTAPQETPYQCFVQGYLTDLTEAYYHIVAVCNTGGTLTGSYTPAEGESLSELISGFTYGTYSNTFTEQLLANASSAANSTRIPMWGICTTKLRKGYSADAPIAVLRSMAKVIVKFAATGYTLSGVTLTHANPQGTLAAGGTQAYTTGSISETTESVTATYTTYTTAWNTETETPIQSPNIPTGIEDEEVLPGLPFYPITEGEEYVIYVPEYRNMTSVTGDDGTVTTTPAASYASMKLAINGKDQDYTLHFAPYTSDSDENPDGPAWDIIRNDIYEYTVTGVKENGGLNARVRVMPWEYETMEYELSQEAEVVLLSEPQAVKNANTNNEYANEVAYSLNDADTTNYATFLIRVDEPKGVRWVAHLTNPYYFTFTSGSQTSGFGGSGETVSITVKPRDAKGVGSSTQLFFTIETLLDSVANISPSRSDLDLRQQYAIRYGSRIDITQVSSKSKVDNGVVPFVVKEGLFNEADTAALGLYYPAGIVTVRMYNPAKDGTNGYNNGVVMTEFNGSLYCMWQTSQQTEDAADTYVAYNSCPVTSETAITSHTSSTTSDSHWKNGIATLCPDVDASSDAFSSSGGWLVNNENKLVAYINTWPKNLTDGGGYTRYMTSADGSNWSSPAELTFGGGKAIFEQDPHVIELPDGTKRVVNAAHFQGSANGGLFVTPIYAPWNNGGISGWAKGTSISGSAFEYDVNGTQSRQMEPSLYQKENGALVMVFRDNQEIDGTYTHKLYASVSTDYGLTWTKPVLTDMPDSKSKQCAGTLPDGTVYMINNPRASINRSPLVITLSADGTTFTRAYLLRSGKWMNQEGEGYDDTKGHTGVWDGKHMQYPEIQTERRSKIKNDAKIGALRYGGYHYPKAMVHGDYLYVSYSTNKEDVEYTRIPLSSIQLNDPSAR